MNTVWGRNRQAMTYKQAYAMRVKDEKKGYYETYKNARFVRKIGTGTSGVSWKRLAQIFQVTQGEVLLAALTLGLKPSRILTIGENRMNVYKREDAQKIIDWIDSELTRKIAA